jgi:preprotein translocase subunit SecY
MFAPSMLKSFFPESQVVEDITNMFVPGHPLHDILYAIFIIFFTYFYTAIIFNPMDIADNLKKSGGFIPGIRPGKKTAEYLDQVLTRITLPGSFFLAFIAVVPFLMLGAFNVTFYFGGTSVLIVVGVALDTLQQLEYNLQMRNYEGFMKKGRLRGRRTF